VRHTPYIRLWYRKAWRPKPTPFPILYLTFDDGPIPEVTPWVLQTLEQFQAKATFFMIGDNIQKNPSVYDMVVRQGHSLGNHTFHHQKGKECTLKEYQQEIAQCNPYISTPFFRPPYGSLSREQYHWVAENTKLVLWDVMSYDFDVQKSGIDCGNKVISEAKSGDVIVFHDSIKAFPRLQVALPMILKHFSSLGYQFAVLPL
jgi:peptidoglycan/xylan/chitin deacetylase (PgdA/CDA1 family)